MAKGGWSGGLAAGAALALLLGGAAVVALSVADRRGLLDGIGAGAPPDSARDAAPPRQTPDAPKTPPRSADSEDQTPPGSPEPAAPAPIAPDPTEAEPTEAESTEAESTGPAPMASAPVKPEPKAPPPPAWKRNAAAFTVPLGRPLVGLVLLAPSGVPLDVDALPPASSLVIDARRPDAEALAKLARASGHEALSVGGFDPDGLWLGEAGGASEADSVRAAGGLALIETPGADLTGAPMLGVDMHAAPGDDALKLFAFLREAAARAAKQGRVVAAMSATPAALRALARWRAVEQRAVGAPVSALTAAQD